MGSSHRKEQILSYNVSAPQNPQNPRNAYSATTATTPLPIGPTAPEHFLALIADNPFPSPNYLKISPLRFGIIGDARSPIIVHHIRANLRNNCNNPGLRSRFDKVEAWNPPLLIQRSPTLNHLRMRWVAENSLPNMRGTGKMEGLHNDRVA